MKLAKFVTPDDVLELATKTGSAADRDIASAGLYARRASAEHGLAPKQTDEGEFRYSVQQGLTAACWAREDAAAVLILQRSVLKRLDTLRVLLLIAISLLAYIAYKLS